MSATAGHGASVRIETCGKTFADGTRALEPATLDIARGETLAGIARCRRPGVV
jgi:putative spermidine/putrescine transport system ATP-binding protein